MCSRSSPCSALVSVACHVQQQTIEGQDLCRRGDEARGRDGDRESKRRRPSEPDLEDGQLPEPPSPPPQARDVEMADADEASARSPRAQEARRCVRWPPARCCRHDQRHGPKRRVPPPQLTLAGCRAERRERKQRDKEEKRQRRKGEAAAAKPDMSAGLNADEIAMMQQLGLPFGFNTTQGAEIEDEAANTSAVQITSQRKPRQFMNRKGGFNRLLPAEQTGKKMQQV